MKLLKKVVSNICYTLADCIIPNMPILIGVGMLKVFLILIGPSVFNILSLESDTYNVLQFISDAGLYFMPIFIAVSSAKVFRTNVSLSALLGAILISPVYINYVNEGTSLSLFKLPVALTDYSCQILPSIIVVYILSKVYRFLNIHINKRIKNITVPVLTILIVAPIELCVIGPIGVVISDYLVDLIMLLRKLGPIGNGIMCALLPFIVIGGLGGADASAMLLLQANGPDEILFFANVLYNSILGFATLAIYFRSKNSDALASSITAVIGGISEPSLFGIVLKQSRVFITVVSCCFIGGMLSGVFGVKSYAMASYGLLGALTTIGPDSSFAGAIISIIVSCAICFIFSFFFAKNVNIAAKHK